MKTLITAIILQLLFIIPIHSFSQNLAKEDSIRLLTIAHEIITSSHTCAFITIDIAGKPQVRMLETLPIGDDFTLWFGTNPKSRKVEEIKSNSNVSVYYHESNNVGYVAIQGKAVIVDEPDEKDKHWKDGWQAYYPDKVNDYLLIKVIPEKLEIVSYTHGIISLEKDWKAPKIVFQKGD